MIAAQRQTRGSSTRSALWIISLVPFIWGALTAMTSLLVPYLRDVYSLSHTQSVMVQVVFSIIPVVMGLPSAFMIGRYGYRSSLFLSLALALLGCGGAIFPMLQAMLADKYAISDTFGLLTICYLVIMMFPMIGKGRVINLGQKFILSNKEYL